MKIDFLVENALLEQLFPSSCVCKLKARHDSPGNESKFEQEATIVSERKLQRAERQSSSSTVNGG